MNKSEWLIVKYLLYSTCIIFKWRKSRMFYLDCLLCYSYVFGFCEFDCWLTGWWLDDKPMGVISSPTCPLFSDHKTNIKKMWEMILVFNCCWTTNQSKTKDKLFYYAFFFLFLQLSLIEACMETWVVSKCTAYNDDASYI